MLNYSVAELRLYYFDYTSRPYDKQDFLIEDLRKRVAGYQKSMDFFKKTKGLHNYLERKGGSLETAIANADKSMKEKLTSGRYYTYSQLGVLMRKLESL